MSIDDDAGDKAMMGLHAVDVPNGSLCRTQIDLRLPARGWLSTVFLACWFIFAVMMSVVWHLYSARDQWTNNRVTNVVLLLVSVSGGTATYIARRDVGGVAARTVTFLRSIGAVAIAQPAITAAFLVYAGQRTGVDPSERGVIVFLGVVSLVVALFVSATWARTLLDERRSAEQSSPWDMTARKEREVVDDFLEGRDEFHFDAPAVGIQSAEGWHERYTWDDSKQREALMALHPAALPRPGRRGRSSPPVAPAPASARPGRA